MTSDGTPLPLADFHSTGLLWYINRVAFHPHGFALAVSYDGNGEPAWMLQGDGKAPWAFEEEVDDDGFEKIQLTFARARGDL